MRVRRKISAILKAPFGGLGVLLFFTMNAQIKTDSVHLLPEVEKVESANSTSVRKVVYHSTSLARTLNDALRENTGIYLKSYGNGQLVSLSFRGTSAQQTDVTWNGIKLNSPSLGQTDVSLLNIGMLEQLQVNPNSQSGNVGAELKVVNACSFDSSVEGSIMLSYGSFNTFRGFGKLQFNNAKFSGTTRISYLSSDNDYSFVNLYALGNPKEKLTNAKVQLLNFMQQFAAKINADNSLEFNLWLSDAQRQIPPIMSKTENKEKQDDYSLRGLLTWKGRFRKVKTEFTSAFLHDVIHYANPEIVLDEKSTMQAFRNNFNITFDSLKKFSVQLNAGYDFERAIVPAYRAVKSRNIGKLSAAATYRPIADLFLQLNLREHLYDKKFSPFSPAFTLYYYYKDKNSRNTFWLQVVGARNFRFPTLNDMYWVPGGNQNLKPEKSWDGEITSRYTYRYYFIFSATGFCKYVTDWIQWIPNGTYWQPLNVKRVLSRGAQLTITSNYFDKDFGFEGRVNYTYTRATNLDAISPNDQSKGKQLIYVPLHVASANLRFEYKKFFLRTVNTYTDAVFITTDNSQSLAGYYLLDLEAGKNFTINKDYEIGISFRVNNVTDKQYQAVAQRPMPGRNFEGTLSFNFRK